MKNTPSLLVFMSVVSLSTPAISAAHRSPIRSTAYASVDAVIDRHMKQFAAHDWQNILKDYADDAVIMGKDGPIEGKGDITGFFHALDAQLPSSTFTTKLIETHGDVAIEDWTMTSKEVGTIKGRDIFIIRNGKIRFQFTINLVMPSSK